MCSQASWAHTLLQLQGGTWPDCAPGKHGEMGHCEGAARTSEGPRAPALPEVIKLTLLNERERLLGPLCPMTNRLNV